MKELESGQLLKEKEKTEVSQEQQQENKMTYDGTIIPHENHVLYEINPKTMEIVEAKFYKTDYLFDWDWKPGTPVKNYSRVVMKAGMVYVSALNKENAIKKLKKGSNGTRLDPSGSYLNL